MRVLLPFLVFCTLALIFLMCARTESRADDAPLAPRIITVGPGRECATPSKAAAIARDGDVIAIDAGVYTGDTAVWRANDLTIIGVNGRPHLNAAGASCQGKAIWVIQGRNTRVENIEFSHCTVPDKNGAGIRQEGSGLLLRACYFHDNENGILTGANPQSDIFIESCEFGPNGYGDGYSHNLYIGRVRSFTMQYCYSHHAKVGHLVKSRAEANYLLYNRLDDGEGGNSSYVIDLPNGGRSFLIGNLIRHGPRAENSTAVSYAAEGAKNTLQELYVINNTFVNARANGKCLRVLGPNTMLRVVNNLVTGTAVLLDGAAVPEHNLLTDTPGFVDAAQGDFRLAADSPSRAAGIDPGMAGDFPLLPKFQYRHPLGKIPRPAMNPPDMGAYACADK